jgi:hypothetical protein
MGHTKAKQVKNGMQWSTGRAGAKKMKNGTGWSTGHTREKKKGNALPKVLITIRVTTSSSMR